LLEKNLGVWALELSPSEAVAETLFLPFYPNNIWLNLLSGTDYRADFMFLGFLNGLVED
jgi:hypothetical protein